jgi:hypothetical protein
MIFVIATLILQTAIARADHCDPIVRDCHKALDKADRLIEDLKAQVRTQEQALKSCYRGQTELRMEVEDLRERETSIWRNPYAMVGLGVIVGVSGYLYLMK